MYNDRNLVFYYRDGHDDTYDTILMNEPCINKI